MRRRGFTLIELLVVVALIAILSSLLVIGIGKLQTNSKRQQTRLTFQNLQAMFADYDTSRRIPFGAGNINPGLIPGLSASLYLNCPQSVTADGASTNDRFGNAVQYTRFLVAQMSTVPNVAASLSKLPSSELMTFLGGNLTNGTGGAPLAWNNSTAYAIYQPVTYTDGSGNSNVFIRSQIYADAGSAAAGQILEDGQHVFGGMLDPTFLTNGPPNPYFWLPGFNVNVTNNVIPTTPVVLDGWGNPIIFVMGGYLGAPASAGSGYLYAGSNTTPTNPFQVHSADYHPFFASAGPDGNFSKGDDNLYSFEK